MNIADKYKGELVVCGIDMSVAQAVDEPQEDDVVALADRILIANGNPEPTDSEYVAALEQAERELRRIAATPPVVIAPKAITGDDIADLAERLLIMDGNPEPTESEYAAALVKAERELRPVVTAKPVTIDENVIHARAVKILADAGKELSHTEDEYLAAYAQATYDLEGDENEAQ